MSRSVRVGLYLPYVRGVKMPAKKPSKKPPIKKTPKPEKNPGGRPTKYRARFCQEIIDFFDVEPVEKTVKTITTKSGTVIEEEVYLPVTLPTVEGFARKLGVCVDTLHEWRSVHPEFSDAFKRAKELQKDIWQQNSLLGLYNPKFTEFFGINIMGWNNNRGVLKNEHSGEVKHTHDLSSDLKSVIDNAYNTQTGS